MPDIRDPIAAILGKWSTQLCTGTILLRLTAAVLFAALIGCERAHKRHSAGLRTFILVAFSSAVSMLLDLHLMETAAVTVPVLSAAAVIGNAMLSGNSVLFSSRSQIKGLTTSVGLWACGIVGLTIGAGLYTVTAISAVLLPCILSVLPRLEAYLKNRSNHFEIHLELQNRRSLQNFVAVIRKLSMRIDDIEANSAYLGSGLSVYTVSVTVDSKELKKYKTNSEIVEALRSLDYINHIDELQ